MGGKYKFQNFDATKTYNLFVEIEVNKGLVTNVLRKLPTPLGAKLKVMGLEDVEIDSKNHDVPVDVYEHASTMLNTKLWEIEKDIRKQTGEKGFSFISNDLKRVKISKVGATFKFEFEITGAYYA